MKDNDRLSAEAYHVQNRMGVTLIEIVVSMLIMGIGITLIATLLPISILRTAQATQLTNGVFLRKNAESILKFNPGVIGNTQICGALGTEGEALGVVDPLGYFLVGGNKTSKYFAGTSIPRISGLSTYNIATAPNQVLSVTQKAAALIQADQLATLPDSWSLVREDAITAYNAATATVTVSNPNTDLQVRNGEHPLNAPYRIVMYDTQAKTAQSRMLYRTAGTSTVGTAVGTNDLSWQNVNIAGALIPSPQIPNTFIPSRIRIETQQRRFTWMITVSKTWTPDGPPLGPDGAPGKIGVDDDSDGTVDNASEQHISGSIAGSDDDQNWAADVNVAIFFNRSFGTNDETNYTLYPTIQQAATNIGNYIYGFDAAPGVSGVDDDNNGLVDWTNPPTNTIPDPGELGWIGSDDNRTLAITVASNPLLKKGGFVLETTQLKWYRILNFNSASLAGGQYYLVLLDQDLKNPRGLSTLNGVFMKGVVDVYPLGTVTGAQ